MTFHHARHHERGRGSKTVFTRPKTVYGVEDRAHVRSSADCSYGDSHVGSVSPAATRTHPHPYPHPHPHLHPHTPLPPASVHYSCQAAPKRLAARQGYSSGDGVSEALLQEICGGAGGMGKRCVQTPVASVSTTLM